ncbi:MAG: 4Fe-4S double cluster binding domain-containing protein [Candidatus Kariarchaeaceae archaeon]|jgi:Pyruvate/2-oxoacid:ferredoxin oxidoreductase delta subunit
MSKLSNKFNKFIVTKIAKPWFASVEQMEEEFSNNGDKVRSTNDSAERVDIMETFLTLPDELIKLPGPPQGGLLIYKSLQERKRMMKSIESNPEVPREKITKEELDDFVDYAKSLGICSIGYTKLPKEYIFQDKAVLHDHAIVLAYEMDEKKIEEAPSAGTEYMVLKVYHKLGKVASKLSKRLRKLGFSAHPTHPLVGLVLYPPLAEKAGIGYRGLHGLIVTPEHGPRIRLTTIFTSITNLPTIDENENEWIGDYCSKCKLCIKKCPGGAILENPIVKENGIVTHIDNKKCFPFFAADDGCGVCLKVCPFSKTNGFSLKKHLELKKEGSKSIVGIM